MCGKHLRKTVLQGWKIARPMKESLPGTGDVAGSRTSVGVLSSSHL